MCCYCNLKNLTNHNNVFFLFFLQDLSLCSKIRKFGKMADIHDTYVVVPADKASNNIIVICQKYHIQCLIKELSMGSSDEQIQTYQATN